MGESHTVAVLGAGSWGTALAHHLATSGHTVKLWGVEPDVVTEINSSQRNTRYLKDAPLNDSINATLKLDEALESASLVVVAVPSFAIREVSATAKPLIPEKALVVSVAKGLEPGSLRLMSQVVAEEAGVSGRVAALSGPSFAAEVVHGLPTAVVSAAHSLDVAKAVGAAFHHNFFRVYFSSDVVGVEIGGAVKNVIALAVGIVDGVGMGHNARAALITRGLVEIQRLASALGGEARTVTGLSGLGDLLLTATGDLSRNRRVGLRLGAGESLAPILKDIGQVAEGVEAAPKILELGERYGVSLPIVEEVNNVLSGKHSAKDSVRVLLSRAPREE